MTACANTTCRRPLPEREPTDSGRPPTFCSRRCQLAARNPDHLHTLRVALPLTLVHRLEDFANLEHLPLDQAAIWLLTDAITDIA